KVWHGFLSCPVAGNWLYGGVVWPVLISGVAGSFDGIKPTLHRPTQSSVTHLRYSYALRPLSDTAIRLVFVDFFDAPLAKGI
ncbi:hypothetical protein ACT7F0_006636, partial [Pseudomonas aeruginosa]